MLRKTASNFLAQVESRRSFQILVGRLRLVPGGQVLLDEISRLLRSLRAIQDLSARIPKVVFVVRIRVARKNLIRAAERGRAVLAPTHELLRNRILQRIFYIGQRKEPGKRIRVKLR